MRWISGDRTLLAEGPWPSGITWSARRHPPAEMEAPDRVAESPIGSRNPDPSMGVRAFHGVTKRRGVHEEPGISMGNPLENPSGRFFRAGTFLCPAIPDTVSSVHFRYTFVLLSSNLPDTPVRAVFV